MVKNTPLTLLLTLGLAICTSAIAQDDEQRRKGPPSFAAMDVNEDGIIDFDEFSAQPVPHSDHQTLFSEIDTNGDNELSEDEFASHKPPRRRR